MRILPLVLLVCGCAGWRDAHPDSEYPSPPEPDSWTQRIVDALEGPNYPSGWKSPSPR